MGDSQGTLCRAWHGGQAMDPKKNGIARDGDGLIGQEWLAVNSIGGYACSTVPGMNTRKYHGLLVAAMAPPVRRMVILSRVEETVIRGKQRCALANSEY